MTIIVDTNILFSACLTPEGRISSILYQTTGNSFSSVNFAIEELQAHTPKLLTLSKHSPGDLNKIMAALLRQVDFYNEELIARHHWQEAYRLTVGVDVKDISFVALALQTGGILWTGDKKLAAHLKAMGFDRVVSTAELYQLLGIN